MRTRRMRIYGRPTRRACRYHLRYLTWYVNNRVLAHASMRWQS